MKNNALYIVYYGNAKHLVAKKNANFFCQNENTCIAMHNTQEMHRKGRNTIGDKAKGS